MNGCRKPDTRTVMSWHDGFSFIQKWFQDISEVSSAARCFTARRCSATCNTKYSSKIIQLRVSAAQYVTGAAMPSASKNYHAWKPSHHLQAIPHPPPLYFSSTSAPAVFLFHFRPRCISLPLPPTPYASTPTCYEVVIFLVVLISFTIHTRVLNWWTRATRGWKWIKNRLTGRRLECS